MEEEIKVCTPYHTVEGKVPELLDIQYDQKVCDCGKIKFYSTDCGCQANPHLELYSKPNE